MTRDSQLNLFGVAPDGQDVHLVTLQNKYLSCEIITYGAAIRSLRVPDRNNMPVDVVLGYDALEDYVTQDGYLGATIGRVATPVSHEYLSPSSAEHKPSCNEGSDYLHGCLTAFSRRVWNIESLESDRVVMTLSSQDGGDGYPGMIQARVTYSLSDFSLNIQHETVSDKDPLCSLTNHSYFNLAGHDSGEVYDQEVVIEADTFAPNGCDSVSTSQLTPVSGTPMDLRTPAFIGQHINDNDPQLKQAHGYDHNYVIRGKSGRLRLAAQAACAKTGIMMCINTTLSGMHFYTANFIDGGRVGKNGASYGPHHAFCLEAQYYNDTLSHSSSPSSISKAGEACDHLTHLSFFIF